MSGFTESTLDEMFPAATRKREVDTSAHDEARTRARALDPDTSHAAARSVSTTMSTRRADVLRVFAEIAPCTQTKLVEVYTERMGGRGGVIGQADSGIRSRLKELCPKYVVDSMERETLASGRKAAVWKLTDAGREEAEK